MTDTATDKDELQAQEQRVIEAMDAFRDETTRYKQLAKGAPHFLRDGNATKLRDDALVGAKLYSGRMEMMQDLVSGGVGAEVGVQFGLFSRFLLDEIKPEKLYLFDMIKKNISEAILADKRTELFVGDSSTCLKKLDDAILDWVYIDGDHSLEGAQKDTDVARTKVKDGGLLVFNDYTPWSIGEVMPYGVMTVVNNLVNEGYPVVGLALAPHGYFDIAVRYKKLPDPA